MNERMNERMKEGVNSEKLCNRFHRKFCWAFPQVFIADTD